MNSHSAYKNNHTRTVDYRTAILDVKKRPSQKRLGRFLMIIKQRIQKRYPLQKVINAWRIAAFYALYAGQPSYAQPHESRE